MSTETAGDDETKRPPQPNPWAPPEAASGEINLFMPSGPQPGTAPDDSAPAPTEPASAPAEAVPQAAEAVPQAATPASAAARPRRARVVVGGGRGWRPRLLEAVLVSVTGLGLAVGMTWPLLTTFSRTVPDEPSDPIYFAWQLAWVSHQLLHDPLHLWTTPAFLGAKGNLAFTDTILGYAPLGLVTGTDMTGGIRMLNLATLLAFALAFVGAYALARALGARVPGALVAGAGFAYAPWRMEQIIHLNILSTGGMALALAFLVRGHGYSLRYGLRPHTRSTGFVVAGWVVATWQITLGFGIGVVFGYMLGGTVALLALGWLVRRENRRWISRRFLVADVLGALAFLLTAGLLTLPYNEVIKNYPEAKRSADWLPLFSPPWRGFLTAPDSNRWWGQRQSGWRDEFTWAHEMVCSPGIVLIVLGLAGVLVTTWSWRRRLIVLAYTLVMLTLAFGTAFPWAQGKYTFMIAYNHLPGWNSMRTPGRLVIWVTLGLCLLAAGLVSAWVDRVLPLPDRGVLADLPRPAAAGGSAVGTALPDDPDDVALDVFGDGMDDAYSRGLTPGRRRRGPGIPLLVAQFVLVPLFTVPAILVVAEDASKITQWELYKPTVPLASVPGPVFILPTSQVADYDLMLWQADGWPTIANGDSGFYPLFQQELAARTAAFPDKVSIAYLRARGVKTVMVVDYLVQDSPQEQALTAPVDGLGITRRQVGDTVLFDLR